MFLLFGSCQTERFITSQVFNLGEVMVTITETLDNMGYYYNYKHHNFLYKMILIEIFI